MEDTQFQQLIPSKSLNVQGMAHAKFPDSSDSAFNKLVDVYWDFPGKKGHYPYCKLEYLYLLCGKCKDINWVRNKTEELSSVFFSLIFDRRLLFAQTRELTVPFSMMTYRTYMTNKNSMIAMKRNMKSAIDEAGQKLIEEFDMSHAAGDTEISKADFASMLEVIQKDLESMRGRPRKLIKYPPRVEDELSYRTREDTYDLWLEKRNQKLYENAIILGIPASEYYHRNISVLEILEDEWKEMAVKWLPRLARNIEASRDPYEKYRPYFFPTQWDDFKKLEKDVEKCSNKLYKSLNFITSENFADDIPLPNKMSATDKLEEFESFFDRYWPKEDSNDRPSSEEAGILFLLRAHLHPIFKQRKVNYPKVCAKSELISIKDGKAFFDKIEQNMTQSLSYTSQDLLSIDNIHIKLEDFESVLPTLDPYVQRELEKVHILTCDRIESYAQIFFSPVVQKDTLKEILQGIIDMLDWAEIPVLRVVQRFSYFATLEQCITTWKECLIEYRLMQCLIEQGYQNLQEITRNLFRIWGDCGGKFKKQACPCK